MTTTSPEYLIATLGIIEDNLNDLATWSAEHNDVFTEELLTLTEQFEDLKKVAMESLGAAYNPALKVIK